MSPQHSPLQKKRSTSSGSVSPRKRNSSSSPGSPRKSLEALGGGDSSPGKEERVRLPTEFPASAGTELVEGVRTRTGMSYKKSLQAVSSVLEFLKSKVPVCSEMVDGLFIAVQHSQVQYALKIAYPKLLMHRMMCLSSLHVPYFLEYNPGLLFPSGRQLPRALNEAGL